MSFDKIPQGATLNPQPYELKVPQDEVDHFYQLIKLSKLAPKTYENLQKETLTYGVTHDWMSGAKQHWEQSYDWRAREQKINSFTHFKTQLTDDDCYAFDMHFVALFSNKPDAFLGVFDVLRKKYTPDTLPFRVVAPSLPGYGLSSGPPLDKDFNTQDIARVIDKLMVGLGFESGYIGQGGDIGAYTCRPLSKYPFCKAIHLNFSWMLESKGVSSSELNEVEQKGIKQALEFASTQSAYALEHGTRPATIGFVLSASPLALLAWIGEKFITWTDTTPSYDEILDSISLYWFTESFARCIYPYRQFHGSMSANYSIHGDPEYYIKQPLGYSYFLYELAPMPKAWVATTGNLVWHKQHDEGGHFAAMEKPELMVQDIEAFVGQIWKQCSL